MAIITQIDVQTGERVEVTVPDEVPAIVLDVPVPVVVSPVDKLAEFLAANPDVAALVGA